MNSKFLSKSVQIFGITLTVFFVSSFPAWADFTFVKAVDENTIVPGSANKFGGFGDPAISNGKVVFTAYDTDAFDGIYQHSEGSLIVVADENTTVPGSANKFRGFGDPAISNGKVVFKAYDTDDSEGIYIANYVEKQHIDMVGIIWLLFN